MWEDRNSRVIKAENVRVHPHPVEQVTAESLRTYVLGRLDEIHRDYEHDGTAATPNNHTKALVELFKLADHFGIDTEGGRGDENKA